MNDTDANRRERDRARKAAWRRSQGMVPQSQRQTTKRAGEIAESAGVSVATVYRHHKAGTLNALLFDPDRLRKKCPLVHREDAKEVSVHNGLDEKLLSTRNVAIEKVLSADTSLSISGISESQRADHVKIIAKLQSEAEAARDEWISTMPPWSML